MLCDKHFDIMFTVYLIHLIKLKLFLLLYICIFYIVIKSWLEKDSPILYSMFLKFIHQSPYSIISKILQPQETGNAGPYQIVTKWNIHPVKHNYMFIHV